MFYHHITVSFVQYVSLMVQVLLYFLVELNDF
jgi:hypothetical protein